MQELRDRLEEILPFVPLTSELARREILISRVVTELIHYTQAELRIEYGLKVSNWLADTNIGVNVETNNLGSNKIAYIVIAGNRNQLFIELTENKVC